MRTEALILLLYCSPLVSSKGITCLFEKQGIRYDCFWKVILSSQKRTGFSKTKRMENADGASA
jgi:hypothetical protein